MRTIGFSTGALAFGDFCRALALLRPYDTHVVELSALRQPELGPLTAASADLDLSQFSYVAVHAPSNINIDSEGEVVKDLLNLAARGWSIVVHPDAVHEFALWRNFGNLLCIENMDKRKPIGRTVEELASVFDRLPDASFCLDLGHARQVDATMTEAYLMAKVYGPRLRQVHISEVNTSSKHDRLSFSSIRAFQLIAELIPENVPLIIESVIEYWEIPDELRRVDEALPTNLVLA
jgi:hypothetical protein